MSIPHWRVTGSNYRAAFLTKQPPGPIKDMLVLRERTARSHRLGAGYQSIGGAIMAFTIPFVTARARRMADPVHEGSDRHVFYVRAKDLPPGLPTDPNPRTPNINRSVYREVEQSLLGEEGEPGTFHWKNKGITIIAHDVIRGDSE